jgi:hypothetical protein
VIFKPEDIPEKLRSMLRRVGRHDLLDGFELDDATLERSTKMGAESADHAIYHALFDRGAPHAPTISTPAPTAAENVLTAIENHAIAASVATTSVVSAVRQAAELQIDHAAHLAANPRPDRVAAIARWIQIAVLLAILAAIFATRAHAQGSSPLLLRGQQAGSTLFTRQSGLITLNCSTGLTCSFSGNTFTMTSSGGAGAVSSVFTRTGAIVAASGDYTAAQVTNAVDSTGSYSDPAWIAALAASKITGTLAAAQLPNPGASSLGGIQSAAPVTHQWINSISTAGVSSQTQPAAADLSDGTTGTGNVVQALSPTITTPKIGQISDTSGNAVVITSATTTAVNQLTVANAATGTNPRLSATGTDATVGFDIKPKGANARVRILDTSGNPVLVTNDNQGDTGVYTLGLFGCGSLTASTLSGMGCNFGASSSTTGYNVTGGLLSFNGWRGYGLELSSNAPIGFSATTTADSGTYDAGIARNAAGVVEINSGAACSTAANCRDLKLRSEIAAGTAPTLSGCSFTTQLGANMAGSFLSGTTGTCTLTITFSGTTAPSGWRCSADDLTTTADRISQSAYTATSCTITGTTVSGDLITYETRAF